MRQLHPVHQRLNQRRVSHPPVFRMVYRLLVRLRILWIIVLAALCMSGCVRYDASVTFVSPYQGELVQHIRLNDQLTALSGDPLKQWFSQIEQRAKQQSGNVQRLSDRELLVTIPFANGADLEQKFDRFFNDDPRSGKRQPDPNQVELPNLHAHLKLHQSNFLLLQRDRLIYEVDLRDLEIPLLSTGSDSLLQLEFNLKTPWGSRSLKARNQAAVELNQKGQHTLWILQPGQVNHVEAAFWMPDPLGIGTVFVILLVVAGFYIKYKPTEKIMPLDT